MSAPAGRPRGAVDRLVGVVALAVVAALTMISGCTIGDIRRGASPPAGSPAPAGSGSPAPAGSGSPAPAGSGPAAAVEQRRVTVPVPSDHRLFEVEFVDAEHGYAMFVGPGADLVGTTSSGPDGPDGPDGPSAPGAGAPGSSAIVLATADGGRSWQPVRHPRPVARNHQLFAGNGGLVLLAEPYGWYVSADAGRTFTHHWPTAPPPDAYQQIHGRFQVCCDADARPKLVQWHHRRSSPLPEQPPLPELGSVAYAGGRLVAAGLRDGRPYVSVSGDEGRTWRPVTSDRELFMVRVLVATDGDAWLVGYTGDPSVFPKLWRDVGDQWTPRWAPQDPVGHPERFTSVVPVGGGVLAVTGRAGSGLVTGGRYADVAWPVGDVDLRVLEDGTLFGADPADGKIWLAPGRGADRTWISLRLERM